MHAISFHLFSGILFHSILVGTCAHVQVPSSQERQLSGNFFSNSTTGTVFVDQRDGVECRCDNFHPGGHMMLCLREIDGAYFGSRGCPHHQICVEDEEKFAPYWEAQQDFCRFNSREDRNLPPCVRSLGENTSTEEILCKSAHENLIDCFKNTADGSQCLYERRSCSNDDEYLPSDDMFPYGNWSHVCHPKQKSTPTQISTDQSKPLEQGPSVNEQVVLEGLDSYFYCLRPDDWQVSCHVTNIAEKYTNSENNDVVLSFGTFGTPYSEHYGPANHQVLFHALSLDDHFYADVRSIEGSAGYGLFLRLASKILDRENDKDGKMIYSDEYLNQFVDAFTSEYNPDGSMKFLFYDTNQGNKNENSFLVELSCTGFRPMALFRGLPYDEESSSCARDSVEVYARRERVWPPMTWSTDGELKMSAICGFVSGSLSFFGSLFIFVLFAYRWFRLKESSTRERLLIGMSFLDVLSSLSIALGPIPSPVGAIQAPWIFGNTASCEAQGFGVQMGFGVPLYNSALCLYYLLVLVFHKSADGIHPIVEAFFHVIPLGFAFLTASTGAALDLFNTNGRICWIEPAPYDCKWNKIIDCSRGTPSMAQNFILGVAKAPLGISFLVITITMLWITISFFMQARAIQNQMNARQSKVNNDDFAEQENDQERQGKQPTDLSIPQNSLSASMRERNRAVYTQSVLYVAAFFLTYIWVLLRYFAQWTTFNVDQWVHTCAFIFWPLQGFWNFFIVFRPTYIRMRRKNPELWFPVVLWKAIKAETCVDPESRMKRKPTRSSARNAALMKSLRNSSTRSLQNSSHRLSSKPSEHAKRSLSLDFNSAELRSFDE